MGQLRSVSGVGAAEQRVMGAEVNTISVWFGRFVSSLCRSVP